jgi:hypothetical protein
LVTVICEYGWDMPAPDPVCLADRSADEQVGTAASEARATWLGPASTITARTPVADPIRTARLIVVMQARVPAMDESRWRSPL